MGAINGETVTVLDRKSERVRRVYSVNLIAKYLICFQDYEGEDNTRLKVLYFTDCKAIDNIDLKGLLNREDDNESMGISDTA